jgi:hypothetical protein
MSLNDVPFFVGKKSPEFKNHVEKIYDDAFLSKVFSQLNIVDKSKKQNFAKFLKKTAVSYLTGKDINSGRIRPSEQKEIFKNYTSALVEVKKRYKEVTGNNSTHANFHDSLKDVIRDSQIDGLAEMFSPYVSAGDGKGSYGGIADKMFTDFIESLIKAAENAPTYINENDKANIDNDFVLWWLRKLGQNWALYTNTLFSIGDYYKELGIYKSSCLDVLSNLLMAIDKNITRKDIETTMRKYKKSQKS